MSFGDRSEGAYLVRMYGRGFSLEKMLAEMAAYDWDEVDVRTHLARNGVTLRASTSLDPANAVRVFRNGDI